MPRLSSSHLAGDNATILPAAGMRISGEFFRYALNVSLTEGAIPGKAR